MRRVAVIGGGIAGLTCASLAARSSSVHLYDKGRKLGGRASIRSRSLGLGMASSQADTHANNAHAHKRSEMYSKIDRSVLVSFNFEHGAQFLPAAASESFGSLIASWLDLDSNGFYNAQPASDKPDDNGNVARSLLSVRPMDELGSRYLCHPDISSLPMWLRHASLHSKLAMSKKVAIPPTFTVERQVVRIVPIHSSSETSPDSSHLRWKIVTSTPSRPNYLPNGFKSLSSSPPPSAAVVEEEEVFDNIVLAVPLNQARELLGTISTAPINSSLPQDSRLLSALKQADATLSKLTMEPCWTVCAVLEGKALLPKGSRQWGGGSVADDTCPWITWEPAVSPNDQNAPCSQVIAWAASRPSWLNADIEIYHDGTADYTADATKLTSNLRSWVIHARADWSRQHLEKDAEWVKAALLEEFLKAFEPTASAKSDSTASASPPTTDTDSTVNDTLPKLVDEYVHRWRYAFPKPISEKNGSEWSSDMLDMEKNLANHGLLMCGDWYPLHPTIESHVLQQDPIRHGIERAYLSGNRTGQRLNKM